jgi:protein-S-isoprenylcysteine O-methyltransferase Ste14
MDGKPPIDKALFLSSKYSIIILWGTMIMSNFGIKLSFFKVPDSVRSVSLALWVLGFLLLFTGRLGLGESFRIGSPKEKTGLKKGGLYRISRNPMYLGVFATLIASALYTLNPILFLVTIYIIAVHHLIVLAEEKYLIQMFGQEYQSYCGKVRRYF